LRKQVSNGIDPSIERKDTKAVKQLRVDNEIRIPEGLPLLNRFVNIASKWLASTAHLTNSITQIKKTSRLGRLAFPLLGSTLINQIKSSDVLTALKPLIDKMQLETAHRLHNEISLIFSYAVVHDLTEYDSSQPVKRKIPAQKVKHRTAIIDPIKVGRLLRDISNYNGTFAVQSAFRISPLLFQRSGEIRQLLWSDIDLESKEQRPYISKTNFYHIVYS
jgi:integrase